ncbi:MAG: integrase, partial [Gammaproteobacteria bacterium]|nr:integrase [Gammaproteobacteria bacterium]
MRRCSRHTLQSYTECFRLLVPYAAGQVGVRPCELKIEHFTGALLLAFLESLEKDRNNSVSTRNVRLATIKSF